MADRECLKGWILAPSPTDGENVPFFVKVRDKDIVWDIDNFPEELKDLLTQGEDNFVVVPSSYWKLKVKGWNVELHADGSYVAKKKINIGENFISNEIASSFIYYNLELPFDTLVDDELFITNTIKTDMPNIGQSFVVHKEIEDESFTNINLNIINATYNFPTNFRETHIFDKSYVYIKIEGNIKI